MTDKSIGLNEGGNAFVPGKEIKLRSKNWNMYNGR